MTNRKYDCVSALERAGINRADASDLRRISMQLHRWHEKECGIDGGCIERDETTGKALWRNAMSGKAYPTRDMETPALKRLSGIMAKYPAFRHYVQTDPRGAALYILTPRNLEFIAGDSIESRYSIGIPICK